ncbi:MAG: phosphatidylinositol-specific phospholipase C domain-containing protein, partial [bacterium]
SIPGSHESCARHGTGSVCQALSITQQLNSGIRFLDIRCKYVSDDDASIFFPIHHYNFYQDITFAQVQQECVDFLSVHNQEVILMNVQQEEHLKGVDAHYSVPGLQFEEKFIDLFASDYWQTPEDIPTLDQVRGKIVLIRTLHTTGANTFKGWPGGELKSKSGGGGLMWSGFDISGESTNSCFKTQNGWDAWNGSDKGDKVEEYLRLAAAGADSPDDIYLNFLSHTQGDIATSASQMNNRISTYLTTTLTDHSQRLGVLPMDFVENTGGGAGCLPDLIIQHNPFKPDFAYSY